MRPDHCHLMIELEWTSGFLRMSKEIVSWEESILGEDVVKIVKMTTKYWEYHISWVNKTASGFERIDCNLGKKILLCIKCCQTASHAMEKLFSKRMSQSMWQPSVLSYSEKLLWTRQLSASPTLISQQPPASRQVPHQQKDCNSLKAQLMGRII